MIYLDNAATTPVRPEVLEAMFPWFSKAYVGNPSSIHTSGIKAKSAIDEARHNVAKLINADPENIIFTSGGTESNNMWPEFIRVLSAADPYDMALYTSELEHKSITELADSHNFGTVVYFTNDKSGKITVSDIYESVFKESIVSAIYVNNELGTINPIKELVSKAREYPVWIPVHTDATQAVGHIPVDVKDLGVDYLTFSGHKIGAPMGIGVLYSKNPGVKLIAGGNQEFGIRPGTENVPAIVGLGKACEILYEELENLEIHYKYLKEVFCETIRDNMKHKWWINGDYDNNSNNIISLTIPGVESESLLTLLDIEGIRVSAGSACSASDKSVSKVLTRIGLTNELAAQTIRISTGWQNTGEEVRRAALTICRLADKIKTESKYDDELPW